jgi:hypothetical protein
MFAVGLEAGQIAGVITRDHSRDANIEPLGRGLLNAPLAAFAKASARPETAGLVEALA